MYGFQDSAKRIAEWLNSDHFPQPRICPFDGDACPCGLTCDGIQTCHSNVVHAVQEMLQPTLENRRCLGIWMPFHRLFLMNCYEDRAVVGELSWSFAKLGTNYLGLEVPYAAFSSECRRPTVARLNRTCDDCLRIFTIPMVRKRFQRHHEEGCNYHNKYPTYGIRELHVQGLNNRWLSNQEKDEKLRQLQAKIDSLMKRQTVAPRIVQRLNEIPTLRNLVLHFDKFSPVIQGCLQDLSKNVIRKPNGRRYNTLTKDLAIILMTRGGSSVYNIMARNLPGMFPASSTVKHHRAQSRKPFEIGINTERIRQFKQIAGDRPVIIIEDGTAVKVGLHCCARTKTIQGTVLDPDVNKWSQCPALTEELASNPSLLQSKIQEWNEKLANIAVVYCLSCPTDPSIPLWAVAMFPTDDRYKAEDISRIRTEIRKICYESGLRVLAHASDAVFKELVASVRMLTVQEAPSLAYLWVDHPAIALASPQDASGMQMFAIVDWDHAARTGRRLMAKGKNFGRFNVNLEHLRPLVDDGVLLKDDLMYFCGEFDVRNDSATRVFSRQAALEGLRLPSESRATCLFVWAMYSLLRAARSTSDEIDWMDALTSACRGIVVIRWWKVLDPDSIHPNVYLNLELIFHQIVYLIVLLKRHWPNEPYTGLRRFSTIAVELLFCVARGFGSLRSNVINFTVGSFCDTLSLIELVSFLKDKHSSTLEVGHPQAKASNFSSSSGDESEYCDHLQDRNRTFVEHDWRQFLVQVNRCLEEGMQQGLSRIRELFPLEVEMVKFDGKAHDDRLSISKLHGFLSLSCNLADVEARVVLDPSRPAPENRPANGETTTQTESVVSSEQGGSMEDLGPSASSDVDWRTSALPRQFASAVQLLNIFVDHDDETVVCQDPLLLTKGNIASLRPPLPVDKAVVDAYLSFLGSLLTRHLQEQPSRSGTVVRVLPTNAWEEFKFRMPAPDQMRDIGEPITTVLGSAEDCKKTIFFCPIEVKDDWYLLVFDCARKTRYQYNWRGGCPVECIQKRSLWEKLLKLYTRIQRWTEEDLHGSGMAGIPSPMSADPITESAIRMCARVTTFISEKYQVLQVHEPVDDSLWRLVICSALLSLFDFESFLTPGTEAETASNEQVDETTTSELPQTVIEGLEEFLSETGPQTGGPFEPDDNGDLQRRLEVDAQIFGDEADDLVETALLLEVGPAVATAGSPIGLTGTVAKTLTVLFLDEDGITKDIDINQLFLREARQFSRLSADGHDRYRRPQRELTVDASDAGVSRVPDPGVVVPLKQRRSKTATLHSVIVRPTEVFLIMLKPQEVAEHGAIPVDVSPHFACLLGVQEQYKLILVSSRSTFKRTYGEKVKKQNVSELRAWAWNGFAEVVSRHPMTKIETGSTFIIPVHRVLYPATNLDDAAFGVAADMRMPEFVEKWSTTVALCCMQLWSKVSLVDVRQGKPRATTEARDTTALGVLRPVST